MNSLLIKFHLVSAVFVGTCLFSGNVARSQTVVLSPDQVFAQTSPSVYKLEVKGKEGTRQGSAVVYKSHVARKIGDTAFPAFSYLVTNAHVVGNEGSVIVKNGPNSFLAKVSYADATLDLALLSVQGIALTAARIDAGYSLRVGEPTFAIGTPRGLENSLSTGVVSGLRESAGAHRIQTNAAISPGSSGGGLFNVFGGLIGITTSRVVDSEGLNFAIDSRHIVEMELVLEQAISIYGYAEFRNLDPNQLKEIGSNHFMEWLRVQRAIGGGAAVIELTLMESQIDVKKSDATDKVQNLYSRYVDLINAFVSRFGNRSGLTESNSPSTKEAVLHLSCEVKTLSGSSPPILLSVAVNLNTSIVNGEKASVTDSDISWTSANGLPMEMNRYTGIINLYRRPEAGQISRIIASGKCLRISDKKF